MAACARPELTAEFAAATRIVVALQDRSWLTRLVVRGRVAEWLRSVVTDALISSYMKGTRSVLKGANVHHLVIGIGEEAQL